MPKPTPENPLVLFFTGKMPSMKNSVSVRLKKDRTFVGLGRKPAIVKHMADMKSHIKQQVKRQGFDYLDLPAHVGVFCRLGVYVAKTNKLLLPNSDLDNAYTSVQETLMEVAINDDRQIASFQVSRKLFRVKEIPEYTLLYLWELDSDRLEEDFYLEDMQSKFITEYYKKHTAVEMIRHATSKRNGETLI